MFHREVQLRRQTARLGGVEERLTLTMSERYRPQWPSVTVKFYVILVVIATRLPTRPRSRYIILTYLIQ